MDLFFLSLSGPEAAACFIFGLICGVLATTAYYIIPDLWAPPAQRETETEVDL
jgi:hypothetical protein